MWNCRGQIEQRSRYLRESAWRHRCCLIGFCLLAADWVGSVAPAMSQYRVDVGDVVEISVARVPELQRRTSVAPDGTISFPLLGTFSAIGLLPSEMQAKIQAMLATKIFKQRMSDGREYVVEIDPDEVTAIVAQYRPIYVNGDVSKPGEQAFRPFMTARQAIALSGGYDMLHLRMDNPILLAADLKGEYQSLWTDLAEQQAHIVRLKSELENKGAIDQIVLTKVPLAPSKIAEIVGTETERFKTEQADFEREKAFLAHSASGEDEQIKVLSAQAAKEAEGAQADAEELQRATELFGKGMLPIVRVTDARRAVLLSSTRKLQTTAQLMQAKREREDFTRQLERLGDQRTIKLLEDLQQARAALSQDRAKLQSTTEKLRYAAARSQIMRGTELKPDITLIRKGEHGPEHIAAEEETELRPGDVVEVALRSDDLTGMDPQASVAPFADEARSPVIGSATPAQEAPHDAAPTATARMVETVPALGAPPVATTPLWVTPASAGVTSAPRATSSQTVASPPASSLEHRPAIAAQMDAPGAGAGAPVRQPATPAPRPHATLGGATNSNLP